MLFTMRLVSDSVATLLGIIMRTRRVIEQKKKMSLCVILGSARQKTLRNRFPFFRRVVGKYIITYGIYYMLIIDKSNSDVCKKKKKQKRIKKRLYRV